MATSALHTYSVPETAVDTIRRWMVTMVFVSSFVSMFEPAPCDLFFLLALAFSLTGGLRFSTTLMPLLIVLLIYNIAGILSWTLVVVDLYDGKQFLIGLAYTSFSGLFFAAYVADDPERRFWQIARAYWVGATIGAALGLLKYYEVEPVNSILPGYLGRAVGAYKDPNVYSTWLVPALIMMMQAFLLGKLRFGIVSITSFLLIAAALFLAFSRGAWLNAVIAAVITITLTYALAPSEKLRGRIIVGGVIGVAIFALLLFILLSIPQTRELFLQRFSLVQSYDAGETGRFGNQLNAIPRLIELPMGFGPYQFQKFYGLAPHNTFLNAFSAAGWLGGISFILFVVSTIIVGLRASFARTPFQPLAIVAFACFCAVTIQGVQIDMEHWRHMYWMVGLIWGFFAATYDYQNRAPDIHAYFAGWNVAVPDVLAVRLR
jgi:hypothetical protein